MAEYDTTNGNNTYDSGLFYDQPGPVLVITHKHRHMKTKVDLRGKTDAQVIDLANAHKTAMTGNANFTTPTPTAAEFDTVLTAAATVLNDVNTKRTAWRTAVSEKDDAIDALKAALVARGGYVDAASDGDEPTILSSGFGVRSPATPPQPLPAPVGVEANMGVLEGAIDVGWPPVEGAGSYVVEQSANVMPRAFAQVAIVTRSDYAATDLTSGQRYVFRVAAVGPLGQGPWSDEATKMAP